MFPTRVHRPPASPASYSVPSGQSEQDYVIPTGDDYEQKDERTSARALSLGAVQTSREGKSQESGTSGVGKPPLHPVLSGLGFTPEEVTSLLRNELVSESEGGRRSGDLADWKHIYVVGAEAAINQTEQAYALAGIVAGSTASSRTGPAVRLRKLRLKCLINRQLIAASSATIRDPTIFICVFRDKIPTTPGTVPTIHGTDANPPASPTLLFSQLGAATNAGVILSVRNPITQDAYEILAYREIHIDTRVGFTYSATTIGNAAPHTHVEYIDVPIHCQQKYVSAAATASDINNINLCVWSDTNYTNFGFSDNFAFASDIEFDDIDP